MDCKKNILLNPGPATTTDTVKMAQVVPDICPREKEFTEIIKQIREDLVHIIHGDLNKYTSVLFCGSGTICMDICINSLVPQDKKILIINNGSYSQRAVEIAQSYGLNMVELKYKENEIPKLNQIEETIKNDSDIAIAYITHNETGTGLLNPIKEIGEIVHKYNVVFCVDTTSSYGMIPIDIERDNIDICMSSAQKGLMAMSGVSFIIGNKKIIEQSKKFPRRSYYCNLYLQYEYFERTGEMHFTPPVQTIYALQQAIKEYYAEGEINKWKRHYTTYLTIVEEMEKLGFRCLVEKKFQAGLVVTLLYPKDRNWDFNRIHDYCYERGFTIYPGKVIQTDTFRICALGAINKDDILAFVKTFTEALKLQKIDMPVKY